MADSSANVIIEAPKLRVLDLLPIIGTVLSMLGFVWMGATYVAQLQDNTRRIVAIEAIQSEARLARIEAKIDFMIDQKESARK